MKTVYQTKRMKYQKKVNIKMSTNKYMETKYNILNYVKIKSISIIS